MLSGRSPRDAGCTSLTPRHSQCGLTPGLGNVPMQSPDTTTASAAAVRGCPMHAAASDGVRPLYGTEAEAQPYAIGSPGEP
ncbi:hypothetical protein GCM10017778_69220 [Streptomyces vinaceus]|nr:hypothetical protein GCM10017778_69220 [Streptomyces vinaceus]